MRAAVIGFGSIGSRHARVLREAGCDVAVVSRRDLDAPNRFSDVRSAVESFRPSYAVIATETSLHEQALRALLESPFSGTIVVEKPLYASAGVTIPYDTSNVVVAYNVRFHPILARLRAIVEGRRVLAVRVTAGQYLPQWRPDADYRRSYSASRELGGGVLRDLSHELDYASWLFGDWIRLTAVAGHVSDLQIETEDVCSIMLEAQRAPLVAIHLDYLDRIGHREIVVHLENETVIADLRLGTLTVGSDVETHRVDRDFTYAAMHAALLAGDRSTVCSYAEGLNVVATIEAIEKAARSSSWIMK